MLRILWGEDRVENRMRVLREICGAQASGKGQILVVPEQASFETERLLCTLGTSRVCRYAEVLSFSRLANRVFSVCGGIAMQTLDKPGRVLAMAQAVQQVQYRLKLYATGIHRPAFLLELLAAVEEFKNYTVSAEALRQAAKQQEGMLAEKLEELALILDSYDAVCGAGQTDPADRLTYLAQVLKNGGFAANKAFYFDGFLDFTGAELAVLQQLLQLGADVTVTVCCDGLMQGAVVFEPAREAVRDLTRRAALAGARTTSEQVAPGRSDEISFTAQALFQTRKPGYEGPSRQIHLRRCADEYEQAEALAAGILHLIRRGYRFSDIAVGAADLSACRTVYEDVFARYEIPAHFTMAEDVLSAPVYEMVLTALEAAQGMERDEVLAWLKSGFAPIAPGECDRLENYVRTWNISGFSAPWTRHPDGFGAAFRPGDQERLAALEELRKSALAPLFVLRDRCKQANTVGKQVLALLAFLEEIDLSRRLSDEAQAQYADGRLRDAQQTAQLYEMLIDALEQMYSLLENTPADTQSFAQLLQVILSQYQVGTIPASLDCVVCTGVRELRAHAPKVLMLTGCNEGLFPASPEADGLFSDPERRRLLDAGLALAPDSGQKLARNLADIRLALSGAREHLFLFTSDEQPSYLFLRMQALFQQRDTAFEHGQYPAAYSSRAALARAAVTDPAAARAAECLRDERVERQRNVLLGRAAYRPGLLGSESVRALYGKELFLSPSQVEHFAGCRQAHFFRSGLHLKPQQTAEFNAPIYGTFVHEILERTVRQVQQEGGFAALPPERVLQIADGHMQAFSAEHAAEFAQQNERFFYLFERNFEEVRRIVQDLDRELRQCAFTPERFELKFNPRTAMGPLKIDAAGGTAWLTGAVDRVDLYSTDSGDYVRVVDYKTGTKDFDYTDLLCGMGLQMLLYLFALEENGEREFHRKLRAAGVLYVPARYDFLTLKGTPDNIQQERLSTQRRKGLLLNDPALLQAMEPGDKPVYLPYQVKKNGLSGDLADPRQMALLRSHVRQELTRIADELFSGQISANPYERGEHSACRWCDYRDCCHRDVYAEQIRILRKVSASEFWKELERKEGPEDGGN